ncbi:MAG TPA: gamma-glutamyltransferase [Gemmatimonadaceae bacterium]|nr:gamma-glutamyltransferase [Gemmatimonadaceae bacterium]
MRHSLAILLVVAAACRVQQSPAPSRGPDVGKRLVAMHGMVASGNPYASEAGLEMLRKGGNAIDAAVAATFAVGVVEPMMSGLGAGGGMLIWRQSADSADYIDFYSQAGATGGSAVTGYTGPRASARGAAIPGGVAGLLAAQAKYGRLKRADVLAPAIRLAADGYIVNSLLAREVVSDSAKLDRSPDARRIFIPNGKPVRAGDRLVQPELAAVLRKIAAGGADAFYRGEVAESMVQALQADGSPLTVADFAAYQPRWDRPLCSTYRGNVVISAPPPQSGMEVLEALNLLEHTLPTSALPARDSAAFGALAGALRVSVADRDAYVGDPRFAAVPASGVASRSFADTRLAATSDRANTRVQPGDAWGADKLPPSAACQPLAPRGAATAPVPATSGAPGDGSLAETTHLSVVDAEGNAVSLTNTNGLGFGSGTWSNGFFFNSAMYNFSRNDSGPNAAAPNKIPASTIAPTILLRDGRVRMVVGSPGSAAIPPAIVQTIVYTLDYGLDPMQALRMPRIIPNAASRLEIEDGFSNEVLASARALGYDVVTSPPTSMLFGGVHVIARIGNAWVGAADPRRDGEVRGY